MKQLMIMALLALIGWGCGSREYPLAGNPRVAATWQGYLGNNTIKTLNVQYVSEGFDKDAEKLRHILEYTEKEHHNFSRKNVYLYFYTGNAPLSIPFPQNQEGTLGAAMAFIKESKPFLTITIMGEDEHSLHLGFDGG